MTDPTPAPPRPSPPTLSFDAKLLPAEQLVDENLLGPLPTSWTVTFGLGGPAANTYAEVRFPDDVLAGLTHPDGSPIADEHVRERILDEVVHRVAEQAYGRSWAFRYRPEQYAESVGRWSPRRREVLVVTRLEVYP